MELLALATLTFDFDFTPKFGSLGGILGNTVMAARFRGVLESVIDGLERYGQEVHPAWTNRKLGSGPRSRGPDSRQTY